MTSHGRTESHTGKGSTLVWGDLDHSSLHSPHAAVGLAVPGINANGALAVLYRPHVVPQLAVGSSSGERKPSVGDPSASIAGLARRWSVAGRWVL